ncbi:MAG: FAD-dependent oxidoreductase, partial [Akkermansiaceae bacterium]
MVKNLKKRSRRLLTLACAGLVGTLFITPASSLGDEPPALYYYRTVQRGAPTTTQCDVLVYGGTPAGVTAAIQAGRLGKNVILLSFGDHVGGLTSGGLTAVDVGNQSTIGGISKEFYDRIGQQSGFRPSTAETLYRTMLAEAGVTVLYRRNLESVAMQGARITSVTMETGETFEAKMFVDGTYEGDLLAGANVSYHVGREPVAAYGENLAGQFQTVSWATVYNFCDLSISPYVVEGDASSGLLPEISSEPFGAAGSGDYRVQAYNFRMHLSNTPGKIPFPMPAGYDVGRYELLARFLNQDPTITWTLNYTTHPTSDGPVQMRSGDSNNAGSFSSDYVGGNYKWPDGTYLNEEHAVLPQPRRGVQVPFRQLYEERERIFQDHVNYQQGLMYFLANDNRVPSELQTRVNAWGLRPDEFQSTGNWPHALYVREGRRMLSDYVMTQANCTGQRTATDSIGQASYAMDSHFCQRVPVMKDGVMRVRNDGAFGVPVSPYPISYRSIVPKKSECENLLVTVCLSSSHVAYGSIRMEPVFMIMGQSAGIAASMSIDSNIAVQDLPYASLRAQLLANGQRLGSSFPTRETLPANAVIIDNQDAGAVKTGDWASSTFTAGYHANDYQHDGDTGKGSKSIRFTPNLPEAAKYHVYVRWTSTANRASNVPVTITHSGGAESLVLNQRLQGQTWVRVGSWDFAAGTTGSFLMETTGTDGYVIADAVAWVKSLGEVSAEATSLHTEEGTGTSPAVIEIKRSAPLDEPLEVSLEISGTASPVYDYLPLPATVTFAVGESTKTLNITGRDDRIAEGDESVRVNIAAGGNYEIGDNDSATVTISDAPFYKWVFQNFTPAERANQAIVGPGEDPDGDGVNNYAEFFSNTNPKTVDKGFQTSYDFASGSLEILRNPAAEAVVPELECSFDLVSWDTPEPAPTMQVVNEPSMDRVRFLLPESFLSGND